ncbi:hypothetical protein AVEN_265972-1 [Araneus ventricosus]|uniref:Uncharacterized protein n=1 Tax=Araneus ventricosus TaxID=182803 RepID=A0A4Y2GJV6_ARAVE|nr:hypothetical protein AVEN_265972-1 [Araneus ventricosus]
MRGKTFSHRVCGPFLPHTKFHLSISIHFRAIGFTERQGRRLPDGKASARTFLGSKPVYVGLLHFKSYVGNQTSSRWCGAKIPTLARPTQEWFKASRGPAGREPLHQHVEDKIYWVQQDDTLPEQGQ